MTTYRKLTAQEELTLGHIRVLEGACADLVRDVRQNPNHDPRMLAVARTKLEGACMWLVRAHTNPVTAFKEI